MLSWLKISIPILAIGGFFIFVYNYWQTIDIEQGSKPLPELVIEKLETGEENLESSEDPVVQSLSLEVQKLTAEVQQFIEDINEARVKSSQVKGIYLNEFVANSQTPWAKAYREKIKTMLEETELNGVVIDVKEAYGPDLPSSLEGFIQELHQKDVWVIARICAFRDSSLKEEKPEWYLKDTLATSSDNIWYDPGGVAWLDPAGAEVQQYIVDFSKKAIDFGFDELQFDYVRFPSDGNLKNIVYPFYDAKAEKYEVIGGFFAKLSQDLREYKPSIILSADLFGYLATQFQSFDIGQRLFDAGKFLDYVSFILYPSHFYSGFMVDYDAQRELPALNFPYEAADITTVTPNNPYPVILRSVLSSIDYLSAYGLAAKVRPWLQDFNLNYDVNRGIIYDAEKVKVQIQGAEDGGASGWLLWNSANIYTVGALTF